VTWNCAGTARPEESVTVNPSVDLIPSDFEVGTPEVTGSECRATPERSLTVSSIERAAVLRKHIAPTAAPTAVETRSIKIMASEVFFFNAIFPEVLDLYLEYRQNQRCYKMRCPLAHPVMIDSDQIHSSIPMKRTRQTMTMPHMAATTVIFFFIDSMSWTQKENIM